VREVLVVASVDEVENSSDLETHRISSLTCAGRRHPFCAKKDSKHDVKRIHNPEVFLGLQF